MRRITLWLLTFILLGVAQAGAAQEIEALGGAVFSVDAGPGKPTLNFALGTIRYGISLTEPRQTGLFAGNTEVLFEAIGGAVVTGPGTVVAAGNILLRRNFGPSLWMVRPYAQLGGGGAYTDIAQDRTEVLLGSEFNFSAEAAVGVRILLNSHCSLLLEHNFLHFSNAGATSRNHGLNSIGAQAGLAFSF